VLEVAAAVALFSLSATVLTGVMASSLTVRARATQTLAVNTALGDLLAETAALDPASLVDNAFTVPSVCPESVSTGGGQAVGVLGESCVTAGGNEYRVLWESVLVDPTACTESPGLSGCVPSTVDNPCGVSDSVASSSPGLAGWVCFTARALVADGWLQRSVTVPVPPRTPVAADTGVVGVRLVASRATATQGEPVELQVTAVGPTGQPLPGVVVQATPAGLSAVSGTTGPDGRVVLSFTVPLTTPTNEPLVVSLVGGGEVVTVPVDVAPAPASLLVSPLAVSLAPGGSALVDVRVVGNDGTGVPGVTVTASPQTPVLATSRLVTQRVSPGRLGLPGTARFYVAAPPSATPGVYTVAFTAGGLSATLTVTVS
jgi:hypothetical protein